MSDQLALPTALDALHGQITAGNPATRETLGQVLRMLQRLGMSKSELMIHVERIRAMNEVGSDDELVEDNALLALELVGGPARDALSWSPRQAASAWLPRTIRLEHLSSGASYALAPNDLLPSRPELLPDSELPKRLVDRQCHELLSMSYEPGAAEFFRSPKSGLTTRPAALLAPQDRLIYEALVDAVANVLDAAMPDHVVWPRGRTPYGDHSAFNNAPRNWEAGFVIRTDVSSYYESIDHNFLAVLVSENLGLRGAFPIALESFLTAVMTSTMGLPQGAPGSDVLGSAYLLDIDLEFDRRGWECARYADDLLIGAATFGEARLKLREVEGLLRERGLHLSSEKTRVVRRKTYLRNLDEPQDKVTFRRALEREVQDWLDTDPDPDERDATLKGFGMSEELLWDLLYHESVSVAEALDQVQALMGPVWIETYERFFSTESERLRSGGYAGDAAALTTRELRECLLIMTGGRVSTSYAGLHSVVDWHPTLVKDVANYLAAVAEGDPEGVRRFVLARIESGDDSDLELAWLLSALLRAPSIAAIMRTELMHVTRAEDRPLSAAIATRALAAANVLDGDTWIAVLRKASPALRAELLLSREAEPDHFPDLPQSLSLDRAPSEEESM